MSVFWFIVAVAIRAFFALARSALINARRARLVELEQRGVTSARAVQHLIDNSSRLLATAEVGATFSLVLAAGIAAPVSNRRIASPYGHDAFLKETAVIDAWLREALQSPLQGARA